MRCRVTGSSWMTSVPVMSVGIRSGVNWMRLNVRSSDWASVLTMSVLASPGTPIEQGVAAAEDGHQQLIEDLLLADDDLADLAAQPLVGVAQLFEHLGVSRFGHGGDSGDGRRPGGGSHLYKGNAFPKANGIRGLRRDQCSTTPPSSR